MSDVGQRAAAPRRDAVPGSVRHEDRRRRVRLLLAMAVLAAVFGAAGLVVGSQGWSLDAFMADLADGQAGLIVGHIRAPRTAGAFFVGALLGLAGAIAQGLFRNPLADPFLLGAASGAGLGVVLVLATASGSALAAPDAVAWLAGLGLAGAAFAGALGGVLLTLTLARGAQQTLRLLLAGVVVGVLLGALSDLVTSVAPQTLRGRQVFLLGNTGLIGWSGVALLATGLAVALPIALRCARVLDALTLGEETAQSLGLPVARLRLLLVTLVALATGLAVSQAGLVAFVGLASPHLVRRWAPAPHTYTLAASAVVGGVLLLAADVLARGLIAPEELPVGVLTAVLGGVYLLWLLHRRGAAR